MQFSLSWLLILLLLGQNTVSQHPLLIREPNFTNIQSNRQHYNSAPFNFYVFWERMGRQPVPVAARSRA